MRRRGKFLSEVELALWRQVARTVKPLPGRAPVEPEPPQPVADAMAGEQQLVALAPVASPRPPRPAQPPLAPLERRLRTQLRRGQQSVGR
jgi:hypothetical protein